MIETNTTVVKVRNTLVIVDIVVGSLVGSKGQTDRPTMSLIELSWTAKKVVQADTYQRKPCQCSVKLIAFPSRLSSPQHQACYIFFIDVQVKICSIPLDYPLPSPDVKFYVCFIARYSLSEDSLIC